MCSPRTWCSHHSCKRSSVHHWSIGVSYLGHPPYHKSWTIKLISTGQSILTVTSGSDSSCLLINSTITTILHTALHRSRSPGTITTDHNSLSLIWFLNGRSYSVTDMGTYILKCFEESTKFDGNARRTTSEIRHRNNIMVTITSR